MAYMGQGKRQRHRNRRRAGNHRRGGPGGQEVWMTFKL